MKTYKEQFYEYGETLGIKINDLQRLMMLAKLTIDKDNFDIGFVDWLIEKTNGDSFWEMYDMEHKEYIIAELLKIYKKEKGL